jgi:hypothetical protein
MGSRLDVKSSFITRVVFNTSQNGSLDRATLQDLLDRAPKGTRVLVYYGTQPVICALWQKGSDDPDGWELLDS